MPKRLDLFPELLQKDWWNATNYPRQLLGQKIALVLSDDDLSNCDVHFYRGFKKRPRMPASMKASGTSEVKNDEKYFQVSLDVDGFEFKELSVTRYEAFIEVYGKQENKRDKFGLVSQEFTRHYPIPYDCDDTKITAMLSDGKLTVQVPKGKDVELFEPELIPVEVVSKARLMACDAGLQES